MALPFLAFIPAIVKGIASIGSSWLEKKKVEASGKVMIAQAKIQAQVKAGDRLYELDKIGATDMRFSWKDEFFVVLLAAPFIMSFIPPLAPYVKEGFDILKNSTPDWYRWAFLGAITASFGLRTWFNGFKGKV
jgi:hypothetical protein